MTVVASFSIKGGVGKTTTAVNLAHIAASKGLRTLLWDLDPQGAASFYLKARPSADFEKSLADDIKQLARYVLPSTFANLDVIPIRFSNRRLNEVLTSGESSSRRLKAMLFPLLSNYDLVVLDCPPGVSALANNALHAADLTLVPTIPTPLSVRTLRQLRRHLKNEQLETKLLAFFCMQDVRRSMHRSIVEYHQQLNGDDMLSTVIPYSVIIERMGIKRKPLSVYAGASPAAAAYASLFEELSPLLQRAHADTVQTDGAAALKVDRLGGRQPMNQRPTISKRPKVFHARRKVRPVRFDSRE
ncbi:MAG: ParA family protein [Pseudomonadota bacterium]